MYRLIKDTPGKTFIKSNSAVIPNVVVNISDVGDDKQKASRLLKSVRGERDWAHYVLGMNATNCRYISSRSPVCAEVFFVTPWEEYLELCRTYFSHGKEMVLLQSEL